MLCVFSFVCCNNISLKKIILTPFAGDGMCDPVIDEHFRRSLGKDYLTLFAKKTSSSKTNDKEESGSDGLSITGLSGIYYCKIFLITLWYHYVTSQNLQLPLFLQLMTTLPKH